MRSAVVSKTIREHQNGQEEPQGIQRAHCDRAHSRKRLIAIAAPALAAGMVALFVPLPRAQGPLIVWLGCSLALAYLALRLREPRSARVHAMAEIPAPPAVPPLLHADSQGDRTMNSGPASSGDTVARVVALSRPGNRSARNALRAGVQSTRRKASGGLFFDRNNPDRLYLRPSAN